MFFLSLKIFDAKLLNNVENALFLPYKKHFLDKFGCTSTQIKYICICIWFAQIIG